MHAKSRGYDVIILSTMAARLKMIGKNLSIIESTVELFAIFKFSHKAYLFVFTFL